MTAASPASGNPSILSVRDLITGYGKKQILNDISVDVPKGEIVALIGHNGAGKSTLLKAIFGLIPIWNGQLFLDGQPVENPQPRSLLRSGVAYVPQGNRVFGDLTVAENLEVGGITVTNKQTRHDGIERALSQFPVLRDRLKQRAGTLSGGEKQMLALANALVVAPRVLLLDEPSLGLSPPMITEALSLIQKLNRDSGVSILIVEQKVREVLGICHRVYALKVGKVTYAGPPDELRTNRDRLREVFL